LLSAKRRLVGRPHWTPGFIVMKSAKWIVPLVFAAATATATAFAEGMGDEPVTRSFDELDANGDGMVTRDEAGLTPGLEDSFDQLDANSDGGLSRDEMGVGGPGLEAAPESGPAATEREIGR